MVAVVDSSSTDGSDVVAADLSDITQLHAPSPEYDQGIPVRNAALEELQHRPQTSRDQSNIV
jgi:hypothetical protein